MRTCFGSVCATLIEAGAPDTFLPEVAWLGDYQPGGEATALQESKSQSFSHFLLHLFLLCF